MCAHAHGLMGVGAREWGALLLVLSTNNNVMIFPPGVVHYFHTY